MGIKTQGVYDLLRPFFFFRWGSVSETVKGDPDSEIDFGRKVYVRQILGTISTFPKLHVMLIVSKKPVDPDVFYPKANDDIIFMMNSGSAGGDNLLIPNINETVSKLYLGYWAHNMHWLPKDFHANATIYYEEVK